MEFQCLLLPLILGVVQIHAETDYQEIFIQHGEDGQITLVKSDDFDKTIVDVVTDEGAMVIGFCRNHVGLCNENLTEIIETEGMREVCEPGDERIVGGVSVGNHLRFILTHDDGECEAKASPIFLNYEEEEVDSSEFGLIGAGKTTCKCGWSNQENQRILGGKAARVNQYSFPALMLYDNKTMCGGSIISPYHILTAGHCTDGMKAHRMAVAVGEHDVTMSDETEYTQHFKVKYVSQHRDYDEDDHTSDIAILHLDKKIEFNDKVGPVCMPKASIPKDKYVQLMGWGKFGALNETSTYLRKVTLRTQDMEVCKAFHDTLHSKPSQICTFSKGKDACAGDSGGPLIWLDPDTNMYTQVGIVSYGEDCPSRVPGIFTDVFYFKEWIQGVVGRTPGASTCEKAN